MTFGEFGAAPDSPADDEPPIVIEALEVFRQMALGSPEDKDGEARRQQAAPDLGAASMDLYPWGPEPLA